ncbi:MAG: hypothetical protein LC808_27415 [Actinobacteria bacterium]|nr:hypothetical protein [Actinomycetota bacterium]
MQWSRSGIAFLVAVVVALHPQAAVSQTDAPLPDIDGNYNASLTVQETCEIGPHVGYRQPVNLKVGRGASR